MLAPGDPSKAVRDAFLDAYRDDVAAQRWRSLADYQAMFPGNEDSIADEWQWLEPSRETTAAAPATRARESIGPYRILDELGRGAQATVYRAEHETLRRSVALKVLHASLLGAGGKVLQRFRREAEVTASLEHSGICSVYETGVSDGLTWIAMQLVPGETLARHLRRRAEAGPNAAPWLPAAHDGAGSSVTSGSGSAGRSELMRIVAFVEQAARALHAAHERGLVHRDVKPGNLMVADDGRPVVLDFGLAHTDEAESLALTRSTDALGTPYYMAPEQLQDSVATVDRRADVWALGVTLYECLCGQRPFDAPSREQLYRHILTAEPVAPRSLNPQLPRDLEVVLQTSLAKERDQRYQSAADFADDLARVRQYQPILARPVSPVGRLWRAARRHPAIAASLAFAILSLTVGLIVSLVFQGRLQTTLITTRALGLASAAQNEVETNPTGALLLALAAIELEERVETRSALHRALASCRELRRFTTNGTVLVGDARPHGTHFVTGSASGSLQYWARSGELRWEHRLGDASVRESKVIMLAAFVGPERDRIVAGVRSGKLWLWDLEGRLLDEYEPRPRRQLGYSGFSTLCPTDRQRLVLGFHGSLQVLELRGAELDRLELLQELELPGIDGSHAISADGNHVAATGRGNGATGKLWRRGPTGRYELVRTLIDRIAPTGPAPANAHRTIPVRIFSVAFSAGRLLVGLQGADDICIDLATGTETTFAAGELVSWLDGTRFVTGRLGGQPRVWDGSAGEFRVIAEPASERSKLKRIPPVVSDDRRRFAWAYQDGPIRAFDRDGRLHTALTGHSCQPQDFVFVPGCHEVFSWSDAARLWALDSELEWRAGAGIHRSPDPAGRFLVAGGRLWTSRRELVCEAPNQGEWSGRRQPFTSDGAYLAMRQQTKLVVVDTARGEVIFELDGEHAGGPWCVLPDSTEVLWLDNPEHGGKVVDFISGEVMPPPPMQRMAYSVAAHGRRVAISVRPTSVLVYERKPDSSWRQIGEAELTSMSRGINYSPDGAQLLVGTQAGEILTFDRDLRRLPTVFAGHQQSVNRIRFSRCGKFVASSSTDRSVRLWYRDGRPYAVLQAAEEGLRGCEFSPDGKFVEASQGRVIRSWFLDTAELIAAARARVTRSFTANERKRFAELLDAE